MTRLKMTVGKLKNKLQIIFFFLLQLVQFTIGSVYPIMLIFSMASQTALFTYFGDKVSKNYYFLQNPLILRRYIKQYNVLNHLKLICEQGCFVFWISSMISSHAFIVGGFGMAVFRLLCILNRTGSFKKGVIFLLKQPGRSS